LHREIARLRAAQNAIDISGAFQDAGQGVGLRKLTILDTLPD
jgi:hypothetical protein